MQSPTWLVTLPYRVTALNCRDPKNTQLDSPFHSRLSLPLPRNQLCPSSICQTPTCPASSSLYDLVLPSPQRFHRALSFPLFQNYNKMHCLPPMPGMALRK